MLAIPIKRKQSAVRLEESMKIAERSGGPCPPARRPPARRLLPTLTTDPSRELHVLNSDRHTIGMNCSEVGVLQKADEVRFGGLLKAEQC